MKKSEYKPVMAGETFGRLVAVRKLYKNKHGHQYWLCHCLCGITATVKFSHLRQGLTKSCGCLLHRSPANKTHGQARSKEFRVWCHAKSRCYCTSDQAYREYGGRGIGICDRWRNSFENFLADMGKCPEGLTLGRIDNDGNYSPNNCRWETMWQQANNKRNNRFISRNGVSKTIAQWSRELGFRRGVISRRIGIGWPEGQLLIPIIRAGFRKLGNGQTTAATYP